MVQHLQKLIPYLNYSLSDKKALVCSTITCWALSCYAIFFFLRYISGYQIIIRTNDVPCDMPTEFKMQVDNKPPEEKS